MSIKDLNEFNFYIGNMVSLYEDIYATNEGIEGENGVIFEYEEERNINDVDDLVEAIEDAIRNCSYFDDEDREELLTVFASECVSEVENWWVKNYGN